MPLLSAQKENRKEMGFGSGKAIEKTVLISGGEEIPYSIERDDHQIPGINCPAVAAGPASGSEEPLAPERGPPSGAEPGPEGAAGH